MTSHSQQLQNLALIAGGVAHDFNNVLTSIVGYAELAKT
jgi:signal transduction histidine kinase